MSDFVEKTRVQIPAILHLNRLGYTFRQKKNLKWDKRTNILIDVFSSSLRKINKNIKESDIVSLLDDIYVSLKNDDLGQAFFLKLQKRSGIRLIDFVNIENNDFSCTYEMPFESEGSDFRPDVTVYVNGMPLAFIEVKVPNNKDGIEKERKRMNDRLANPAFSHFFNEIQLMIFSNNQEYDSNSDNLVPIQGSFYSTVQRDNFRFSPFREEDTKLLELMAQREFSVVIENEVLKEANAQSIKWTEEYKTNINGLRPTNRIITSLLSKERFMFLLNYGFCYVREKDEDTGISLLNKHVMRYPQLLGSLTLLNKLDEGLRKGIFWHSQGSGKTELSFYLVKILTDYFYKKRQQNARFLFIPDRMDLLKQARDEFNNRGLTATTVGSKNEFVNAIRKPSGNNVNDGNYEIMVLNTQKLSEESQITSSTHYSTNNQTIIIVDECHRSYDENGAFLGNLLNVDKNAIIIGLTGTPIILGKDESKSKALFGNYIHKYFYNQSIADGCTLKLMREEIVKTFYDKLKAIKTEIVQKGSIDLNDIYCYPTYVDALVEYIVDDFHRCQLIHDYNSNKKTGAMIVCYSNPQAEAIVEKLKSIGEKAELITYKVSKVEIDNIIDKYKRTNDIDFLVVQNMLLTGFDCKRLKKLYLLRALHEHNLLQGLTRVNRPFKNYKYGYIVDFEGIMNEFNKTNEAYMRELNELYGDDVTKDIQVFVDATEIQNKLKEIEDKLFTYETKNIEEFTNQINQIESFKEIQDLKKVLDEAKDLYNVARSSDNSMFYKLDINTILKMSREVDRRYERVRLNEALKKNDDESRALVLDALASIDFKFIKAREHELVLADKWRNTLTKTREQFERSIDKNDVIYIRLIDELKRILNEHNLEEVNEGVLEKLEKINSKIANLNARDLRIAKKYDEDFKFVRLHKRFKEMFTTLSEIQICNILKNIKAYLDDMVIKNGAILNNKSFVEKEIMRVAYNDFKQEKCDISREDLRIIDNLIYTEYRNEYIGVQY